MKAALLQISSSDTPEENAALLVKMAQEAHENGAQVILTPEVSNIVTFDNARMKEHVTVMDKDPVFTALSQFARQTQSEVIIGSLAVLAEDGAGKYANRCVALDKHGAIAAQYDKIHLFDANPRPGESYRESDKFIAGDKTRLVTTRIGKIGLSICYDVRFAALYRKLAQNGAQVLNVPAAFTVTTGKAHWQTLLQARAIETGSFVLAAAQCGAHPHQSGPARHSYGHSMAIDPWGQILGTLENDPGILYAQIDPSLVEEARRKVPAIYCDPDFH